MEQEVYYDFAEEILERANHISQIIVFLVTIYYYYNAMIGRLTSFGNSITDSIVQARKKLELIKKVIDRLSFLLSWISSYGELAFLYAEDLTVYIHHHRPR